eukprot:CAMPEP_0172177316 /NCGR_PEP_ID=MMETSP1050-20130122/15365_1 /TAXON_ID=233186 /ORGANISM="Cryptomonas curvata, Strain CCAP979/52" /LENGTH=42 /DNA_ID= /DNA_START= /DNA_END= /DNA_ORIENTATION=
MTSTENAEGAGGRCASRLAAVGMGGAGRWPADGSGPEAAGSW